VEKYHSLQNKFTLIIRIDANHVIKFYIRELKLAKYIKDKDKFKAKIATRIALEKPFD